MDQQNNIRTIPLSNGFVATIDAADFEKVNKLTWFAKKTGPSPDIVYAAHSERINGRVCTIFMHRLIMDCPPNKEVDHKNRDRLNNRRSNLEIVSPRENGLRRWK